MRAYACILVESQQITDLSVRFDAESIQEKKKKKENRPFSLLLYASYTTLATGGRKDAIAE